jgi:formate dehydrogenase
MAKVVCVLYDDPIDGYPPKYARDNIPKITKYPDGQTAPTPSKIDFKPGELLGSVSGELGLRKFLEDAGHTLVVTSSKDGEDSVLDKELPDAEIVISQPFWPAYMTKERFDKAKKLKLIITAGIGSDHTDLQAAMDKGVTVAEVTYSNSISVAEHIVMMILALVRNYIPSYGWVIKGGWNIASILRSFDRARVRDRPGSSARAPPSRHHPTSAGATPRRARFLGCHPRQGIKTAISPA